MLSAPATMPPTSDISFAAGKAPVPSFETGNRTCSPAGAGSPHRSASLAVLVAPDVPAVLIELGYLSNKGDAAQMNTSAWRARVALAIADAVDAHFAPPTRQAQGKPQ